MATNTAASRLKVAELTSGVGALVLGIGIGSLFPRWFGPAAAAITIAGIILHAFGMWDKHQLESTDAPSAGWVTAVYWICWVMLAGVVVWLLIIRRQL